MLQVLEKIRSFIWPTSCRQFVVGLGSLFGDEPRGELLAMTSNG